jgi:hypothetical protein
VGEPGNESAGFGTRSRTSIFDYIGVPHHQRWMNGGKFDGGLLRPEERTLRDFYQRLLNFTLKSGAMTGVFQEIQTANRQSTKNYGEKIYSFVRWSEKEKLVIVTNFSHLDTSFFELIIPADVIKAWGLANGTHILKDQLYDKSTIKLTVENGQGRATIRIAPSESFIYQLQ